MDQGQDERIVSCAQCGQQNILPAVSDVLYQCSGCGAQLPGAHPVQAARKRRLVHWFGLFLLVLGVCTFAVLIAYLSGLYSQAPEAMADESPTPIALRGAPPPPEPSLEPEPQVPVESRPAGPERPSATEESQDSVQKPAGPIPQFPPRSLANGSLIKRLPRLGNGILKIRNETTRDAVIKLVDSRQNRALASVYVGAGQTAFLQGIENGNYQVVFGLGTDWDSEWGTFTRDKMFHMFDDVFSFGTSLQRDGSSVTMRRSFWEISFQTSGGTGTSSSAPIEETRFIRF